MKAKNSYLSVIVPVYNESDRLKNIQTIFKYLNRQKFSSELIVINDGSTDNSLSKLTKISKQIPLKIISYQKNQGKGFALKKGFLEASGQYQLFMDIDLATPIEEFGKFIPYLKHNDIIIATRKHKQATLVKRQLPLRENLGKGYTLLSQIILGVPISDFTCGFKCFSKKAAKKIFIKQKIKRWGFDPEVLFIAKNLGFSIKEIPIRWKNDPRTKVKFPQDLIGSFLDLIKIRYYHIKGSYGKK